MVQNEKKGKRRRSFSFLQTPLRSNGVGNYAGSSAYRSISLFIFPVIDIGAIFALRWIGSALLPPARQIKTLYR